MAVQRVVQKHKVKGKYQSATCKQDKNKPILFGITSAKVSEFAKQCNDLQYKACNMLYLLPIQQNKEGEYEKLEGWKLKLHYGVMSLSLLTTIHKLLLTLELVLFEEFHLATVMSLIVSLIYMAAWGVGLGVLGQPADTVAMLNSWAYVSSALKEWRGLSCSPYDDLSTALKLISTAGLGSGICTLPGLLSLISDDIPVCWFPIFRSWKLIPDGVLPNIFWQVLFLPIEVALTIPPVLMFVFSGFILMKIVGILTIFSTQLRTTKVRNMSTRKEMELLYISLELHNRVVQCWIRDMLPSTIFIAGTGVTFCLFITIRFTELPLLLYIMFPYIGAGVMLVVLWMSYDVLKISWTAEDALEELTSGEPEYIRAMPQWLKKQTLSRASAMRPLMYPIGNFTKFSLALPTTVMGRKRGKKRGVQKAKAKRDDDAIEGKGDKNKAILFGISTAKFSQFARLCNDLEYKACNMLYLLPVRRKKNGEFERLKGRNLKYHYAVLSLSVLMTFHKLAVTLELLLFEEFHVSTVMSMCVCLVYMAPWSIGFGVLCQPNDTTAMLNSWAYVSSALKQLRGTSCSPFDDLSTVFKLLAIAAVGFAVCGAVGVLSLMFADIPVCWLPIFRSLGLIPDGLLPTFVWQLIFLPVEIVMIVPPVLIFIFAGFIMTKILGVLQIFSGQVRKVDVTDFAQRRLQERLYICLELHNRVVHCWVKDMLPPTIFIVGTALTFCFFVTIRFTDLPLILYVTFPYVGTTALIIMFWMVYDVLVITEAAEEVRGKLLSWEPRYIRVMPRAMKVKILKRARAMRPLLFPIGNLSYVSQSLPITVWEESLNQIIFLLSF